ncbi:MAG: hypothetical protein WDZ93_03600 [Candidatus Paceibacterota bacterium]
MLIKRGQEDPSMNDSNPLLGVILTLVVCIGFMWLLVANLPASAFVSFPVQIAEQTK